MRPFVNAMKHTITPRAVLQRAPLAALQSAD